MRYEIIAPNPWYRLALLMTTMGELDIALEIFTSLMQTSIEDVGIEIKHPYVTKLLELIEEYVLNSPRICLVFEFMHTDLENIINNNLHNNWMLHRDLNPNNLLIDKRGVLKISDFGLANFFGSPSGLISHDVVTR
ncbi:unnamed protein product [Rotaria sp. Silwood1]|nr:unnamed protein product [Rotaria sp. Silwood1]CAF3602441.1 unnamed protein product [Rotaria sp. Silwood1]